MKPHPHIRKTIKYGGAALTVLLAVVWITSVFRVGYLVVEQPVVLQIRLEPGVLIADQNGIELQYANFFNLIEHRPPVSHVVHWRENTDGFARSKLRVRWLPSLKPTFPTIFGDPQVVLPLWILIVVCGAITALAFRLDTLGRRRERMNLCMTCHYDRTGLPSGTSCPECGEGGPAV